ncbi:MAG TPA: hypothetical protein VFL66_03785 [Gaiellaceae bacterium]|nr:hypothetical protein [Gaiellaceae bacterium]
MAARQVVWVRSEAVAFHAPCEACRAELALGRNVFSVGLRSAVVEGTLRREADVGFAVCHRGHRVVVRRTVPARLAAAG